MMNTPGPSTGSSTASQPGLARDSRSGASRKKVSRACDWCRTRRIGCDNGQPCRACRQRGGECTHNGASGEPRTLPKALREIDRLKQRVRELESELLQSQNATNPMLGNPVLARLSSGTDSGCGHGSGSDQDVLPNPTPPSRSLPSPGKSHWEGIYVATGRSDQTSYYGPSSLFYFISRMGCYLTKALKTPVADRTLQPRGAARVMNLGLATYNLHDQSNDVASSGKVADTGPLSRTQEESILKLFWESYHCLLPVIDETDFGQHYASLWDPSLRQRKPSPLADMVLAVCLQYGHAFIPQGAASPSSGSEGHSGQATVAGRWYYHRAQSLLSADLESPTITTVQCYIFATVYLCSASSQNMCHIAVAQAIRMAHILGLHLEPPADMQRGQGELRKRIWWVLWSQDVKTSLKHGRPLMIDRATTSTTLPSDDQEVASFNNSSLAAGIPRSVTWLTFNVQAQRLYLAVVDIHDALFTQARESISQKTPTNIYKDPSALESCAASLAKDLHAMTDWVDQLPAELKMQRRGSGEPYSTDRSLFKPEPFEPNWLQNQRICLELTYHTLMLNLTRPFITFYSNPASYTPMVERLATACVNHAVSYTLIMHQAVTETDLMSGWTDFFSLQWNAAVTMIGFVIASPIHPASSKVREAIDKAIAVFDVFGRVFAISADAAAIARDLMGKADLLAGQLGNGLAAFDQEQGDTGAAAAVEAPTNGDMQPLNGGDEELAWLDSPWLVDSLGSNDFTDWVQYVDLFNT